MEDLNIDEKFYTKTESEMHLCGVFVVLFPHFSFFGLGNIYKHYIVI